ncbi:type 4a pilus biogenesis protein PilO [Deinococcus wulumuqiensis]|uniref:type 4a pilus biogenesis protein PilO n=1 Tax=Deinococcus wulumuqiensis TaxID=980427 RepID=UPI00242C8B93|nr:GspMb/PilO family protein [Deinococcus wulumuqiensis]
MNAIKLAPQYIFALALTASLVLGYLFYTLAIQPRQLEITALNDEITGKETTLAADQAKAARVPVLTAEVARLEVERDKFLQALPPTANFGQVVANLRQTVSAAGGDLKTLSFGGSGAAAANLPAGVRPIGMTLTVDGKFPQLFQILRSLELQGRFTTVDNVSLQSVAAAGSGTGTGGLLSSTLGLTVYTFDAAQAAGAPAAAGTVPGGTPPAAAPAAPAEPAAGGTQP